MYIDPAILKSFTSLENDNRKIIPGSLFFALPGLQFDGHDFIPDAIKRGARGIVHQKDLDEYEEGIFYLKTDNPRSAMSSIADAFYDHLWIDPRPPHRRSQFFSQAASTSY